MRRREFISALGGVAVWPLTARAQQPERMRRISVLQPGSESDPESQHRKAAFVDLLGNAGYQLVEAENGEEALAAVAKQRPDLILMDIQLPVMDGYEAARRIKSTPDMQAVPLIAVTSYALARDEARALAVGCTAYITKPFSPRALLAKVQEHLALVE
jgi:two-component system cell cycle response regulator DivK